MYTITQEEFLEKYGDTPVVFDSFYKHCFKFAVDIGNLHIFVEVGGNADEIYEYNITTKPILIKDLVLVYEPIHAFVTNGTKLSQYCELN